MNTQDHITGRYGTAESVIPAPETIAQQACLAVWFLHLPKVHPFWFHYVLSIIHLRPIAGAKDAKKDYPKAEYELMLYALDPAPNPRADKKATWRFLQPINMRLQFHGIDDAGIAELARLVAYGLVNGHLIAEPQGIHGAYDHWRQSIAQTIEHISTGGHAQ